VQKDRFKSKIFEMLFIDAFLGIFPTLYRTGLFKMTVQASTVTEEGAGECVDPEGNGVNPGEGDGGGPGPPSVEQDYQLISTSGEVETPMGQPGRQEHRKTSPT
jgi:hypothetical protein